MAQFNAETPRALRFAEKYRRLLTAKNAWNAKPKPNCHEEAQKDAKMNRTTHYALFIFIEARLNDPMPNVQCVMTNEDVSVSLSSRRRREERVGERRGASIITAKNAWNAKPKPNRHEEAQKDTKMNKGLPGLPSTHSWPRLVRARLLSSIEHRASIHHSNCNEPRRH